MRIRFWDTTMTLKAIPRLEAVNMSRDTECAYDIRGEKILEVGRGVSLGIDVKFSAVQDGDSLMQITMK